MITKKIIIVDLEATCWEEDGEYQKNNSEIIEIGICLLDIQSGKISEQKGILVKPMKSEVSEFCTRLTTITPKMLEDDGISLSEACQMIEKHYNSKDYTWASYGAYDKHFLKEQCKKFNVNYPMSENHLNIKVELSKELKMRKGIGMKRALNKLKIPLDGTHHRGIDDANNSAKILKWVLNKRG
ncbi:3'-5' exonuclease [Luteirhabdus pelagi]|uniref:3'-5' exonuclease n=1 Tax=Luteirhabdus pelagi TaxID=2792783 RepID=UPI0019393898|nr:3'-5' exonuclease [Luteirhabdus pelagi]